MNFLVTSIIQRQTLLLYQKLHIIPSKKHFSRALAHPSDFRSATLIKTESFRPHFFMILYHKRECEDHTWSILTRQYSDTELPWGMNIQRQSICSWEQEPISRITLILVTSILYWPSK